MKKLTPEQVKEVPVTFSKRISPNEEILSAVDSLEIDEGPTFEYSECKIKSPPYASLSFYQKRDSWKDKKFRCRRLADKEGWLVIRLQ